MTPEVAEMAGNAKPEGTITDGEISTQVLESSMAVGDGAESPAGPSVTPGPHISKGKETDAVGEETEEEAAHGLNTTEKEGGPVSELPVRLRDQISEDSGSESEPDHWKKANIHNWKAVADREITWSSRLNTARLYQAYVQRLHDQDAKPKKDEEKDKETVTPEKAPIMIRGVIDYVRVLEERIQRLEKLGEGENATQTKGEGKNESGELIMEAKFFHTDGEFDAKGNWQDNIHKKGSYQCVLDPKYLIRVLYNWSDGTQRRRLDDTEQPDPNDVEVVAFGLESEPIAKFLQHSLGFQIDESNVVRFARPFRPLIRSSGPLRAQLEKLESKFETTSNPTTIKQASPVLPQDDTLPFSSTSKEDSDSETSFNTIEALAHFRLLFKFMDEYLAKPFILHQRLRDGLEDKIAFENLWMLFDNGENIYCPSYSGNTVRLASPTEKHISKPRYVPQLFQVINASGGLPIRSTRASRQIEEDDGIFTSSSLSEFFFTMNYASSSHQDSNSGKPAMPSKWRGKNRFSSLHVICFHVDFDGVKYGTVREILEFKPHDGLVDIRSLTAFPIQYLRPEPGRSLSNSERRSPEITPLVERGRKFIDVTASAHLSYEGLTVGQSREEINSAVIVDFNLSYQEYQSSFPDSLHVVPQLGSLLGSLPASTSLTVDEFISSTCGVSWCHKASCSIDTYIDVQMTYSRKVEERIKGLLDDYEPSIVLRERGLQEFKQFMEEHNLIGLLPGVVPGFVLRNRKWVQLNLDLLSELQQGDDWEQLVLPPGHREMVQAMVVTHARGSQQAQLKDQTRRKKAEMDLVQGKGRGCIILLHGVPGVGKTSTAECVAAYTQRPLYPITCGDIGYLPAEVEKNMEEHFKLAHKWGCVLLLDEADVFLAKRNKADVKRNGLVSVFLRILEYYPGILFLTTNRVGAIDDAFRSRLHLTLYYPKLTKEQTRKIWKNNLNRLKVINRAREENNQEAIRFVKKDILEWVKLNWQILQWNGRQIRNAFQTAIALAEFHATNDDPGISSDSPRKSSNKGQTKGPLLDVSQFKVIANATLQFNDYLLETHGFDEDELAKRDKIRLSTHETKLKLKDVARAGSSSSDESESEAGSGESSSDESAKEAANKKAKRRDEKKKKKSKTKRKSKKAQSSDSSSDSDTEVKDKKLKTKKKAKKVQSEGSSDESDKGDTTQKE